MFLSGGCIYCATFLISSNHDYRMIFLIFLLPFVLNLNLKPLKYLILICIILSLEVHRLIYFFGFYGGVLNNLSKTVLFILISMLLIDVLKKILIKKLL